jgi:PEGA domain-containing protein
VKRSVAALGSLLLLVSDATALAQPESGISADSKRDEALPHFERGLSHLDRGEWSAALAEFLKAREIYPTRSATKNAAICLRKEGRFDEALDMFELLEHDYPDLSANDRELADQEIADLRRSVGTLTLSGSETGAAVNIDGRRRGTLPLPAALRVAVGSHVVRVYKDGFVPFEGRVDIASEQTVELRAPLVALTRSGHLRVTEESGVSLDVLVDNVVVGKTPWEGSVMPGPHTVMLRGEGNVGTPPASASVTLDQVTPIVLVAEELDAVARVNPTPVGALVAIDGVAVGRGIWEGRLRSGAHRIEVTADGFIPASRIVALPPDERKGFGFVLDRDPTSPFWGKSARPRFVVDVHGDFALSPLMGGQVAASCTGACSASVPLGGLGMAGAAYQLPNGLGFGVEGGYLGFVRSLDNRPAVISGPTVIAASPGTVTDQLTFKGVVLGGSFYYQRGDRWPITLRIGVGVVPSTVSDVRSGTFRTVASTHPPPNTPYAVTAAESDDTTYLYAAPEVRFGRRLGEHLEFYAGVQLFVLATPSQPSWMDHDTILAGPAGHQGDGQGTFGVQTLSGEVVLVLAPGLGARYEF